MNFSIIDSNWCLLFIIIRLYNGWSRVIMILMIYDTRCMVKHPLID